MKEIPTCNVVDQFCDSPANVVEPVRVRGKCFACGLPVCTKCSVRRKYMRFGTQRICNPCQKQNIEGGEADVKRRTLRLAGYP